MSQYRLAAVHVSSVPAAAGAATACQYHYSGTRRYSEHKTVLRAHTPCCTIYVSPVPAAAGAAAGTSTSYFRAVDDVRHVEMMVLNRKEESKEARTREG